MYIYTYMYFYLRYKIHNIYFKIQKIIIKCLQYVRSSSKTDEQNWKSLLFCNLHSSGERKRVNKWVNMLSIPWGGGWEGGCCFVEDGDLIKTRCCLCHGCCDHWSKVCSFDSQPDSKILAPEMCRQHTISLYIKHNVYIPHLQVCIHV